MKSLFILLILVSTAALVVGRDDAAASVTPVQQVIKLMEDMVAKGEDEKSKEHTQFAAYKQFCDDTSVAKQKAIAQAEKTIVKLKTTIEKLVADAAVLEAEIADHEEDISVWQGDLKAATKVRAMEEADYNALHKDYSESIDALGRAIDVVKKSLGKKKQAESLLQVSSMKLVEPEQRRVILSFLEKPGEAHGYESRSGGIVEMMEGMLDKFNEARTKLEKQEMTSVQEFEMLKQDLLNQLDQAEQDSEAKKASKSKKLQKKADAEGDVVDTTDTMEADKVYLKDMVAECEAKANAFVARMQLRVEELKALRKAIEIVSSGDVADAAEKHLPSLLQTGSGISSSFASLRSEAQNIAAQERLRAFLQSRANRIGSRVLSALALRVADDPFKKVKKMIGDLITKLMEEANEEAEQKAWCDTELSTNEQTRVEKTQMVESLHAEIDQLTTSIVKLGDDIAALAKALSDLQAAMEKATDLRAKEKAKNAKTIDDAKVAQKAVAQALVVLKEFYAKAEQATALVQDDQKPPEIFDEPYKGMGGAAGGVVGMLEVIEADFARLEADTKADEEAGAKEYEKFMEDSKIDIARMTTDSKHKTAKKLRSEKALIEKKKDLEGTQKELDAALIYFEKLKPTCIGESISYEERVARRKEEIISLQDALKILSGDM